jgi:hypothetical protein|tara:strand:+ start:2042 stop:2371 length:330 start_codon:yes stop_codon:yes gene_type:complete
MTAKKLEKDSKYNKMDSNQDGVVSDAEIDNWQQTEEVKRLNRKQMHQRNMAWVALGSMLVFTIVMFTPLIPDSRIQLLTDVSNLFYLAQAGIVGAFMGFAAFDKSGMKK